MSNFGIVGSYLSTKILFRAYLLPFIGSKWFSEFSETYLCPRVGKENPLLLSQDLVTKNNLSKELFLKVKETKTKNHFCVGQ